MRTLAKWTVEDYHRMIETGILVDRRLELIAGEIVEMTPEGPLHRYVTDTAADYLRSLFFGKAKIFEAHPITLPDSEPEPDIAIVRLPIERYRTRHPIPEDIYWIIEISDSTLTGDLDQKKKIYAGAGILEYWVVNAKSQLLKVFCDPFSEDYRTQTEYTQGIIQSLAFPDISIAVERILGK
ncbi:hypothetical protein C7H19_12745 [Aphanothece hegewaldii CCALA 016]|uniref:Putative restriction endonuclease domain-containing protein n=1 Tax=Aphanothece hegewaldii CCALA 016 TaxID=2107694 RepID=A0A2T1LXD2_9CHRO|nr:Uma2 family endonuclease [Aphanothece hegewaldii]PSF36828.1 hypothetical protein C7H19_12745 [Aphanothece hegewaldii CCALA 016]